LGFFAVGDSLILSLIADDEQMSNQGQSISAGTLIIMRIHGRGRAPMSSSGFSA
jgi:hypothetical protein